MSRIVKLSREYFKSKYLFEAEKKLQLPLRLAVFGLLTCCAIDGSFQWKPLELKKIVFPYDKVDFEQILEALLSCGFIEEINFGDRAYGYFSLLNKHTWSKK